MKIVTTLILLLIVSASVLAKYPLKAPFNGNLLDKDTMFIFVLSDGTEITKYSSTSNWYLTKEVPGTANTGILKFVKRNNPTKIVYETSSGDEFSTYDFKNWVIYNKVEDTLQIIKSNSNILEITKNPKEPISYEFFIEFKLKTNTAINLTIFDMQGQEIQTITSVMNAGINHFNLNIENFLAGSYTYKISAGNTFYSGIFIKI
jgi:hypothetical protein